MEFIELTEKEKKEEKIRFQRDILLTHIDKFQKVLVYDSLTDFQKQELIDYRIGLLESPQKLELPVAPDWILK